MSLRHSPGPLTVQAVPTGSSHRKGFHYCIRDQRNICLAVVGEVDAATDGAEAEANAYLYSAGPDLLKAMEALLGDAHLDVGPAPDAVIVVSPQVVRNARAAVRKARGA